MNRDKHLKQLAKNGSKIAIMQYQYDIAIKKNPEYFVAQKLFMPFSYTCLHKNELNNIPTINIFKSIHTIDNNVFECLHHTCVNCGKLVGITIRKQ